MDNLNLHGVADVTFPSIAVVGSGLIGGSIVKSLRLRRAVERIGVVDVEPVIERVSSHVDEVAVLGSKDASALVASSQLIILACPVGAIIAHAPWVLGAIAEGAVVTDTGSSKRAVLEAVAASPRRRRFVAGHPMAGREVGGFAASDANLFVGARWFVVSEGMAPHDAPEADAVARVHALVRTLGAVPQPCDATSHDRAMAYVSHVPQLVSSAIHGAAARAGTLDHAGPGFRDVTRIAGGAPTMWRDIFETNREYIAEALGELLVPLLALQRELEGGDPLAATTAVALLEEAHATKVRALAAQQPNAKRSPP